MRPTTAVTDDRRNTSAETLTVDQIVDALQRVFENCGIAVSRSRVSRLARTYKNQVEGNGFALIDFVVNAVAMTAMQRMVVADELTRVIAYSDPTGETAVNNVMNEIDR